MIALLKKIFFEIKYLINKIRPIRPIILMYHRVAEDTDDSHLLCVSPKNFRDHIQYLKKYRKIVTLEEITKNSVDNKSVAITFDDGYGDNLYNALPILQEFNAPATIFISTGFLGQKFPWDNDNSSGMGMTENEIIELSKNTNIEIGAHTMTHPHLSTLSYENKKNEIENSKKELEKIITKPVLSFAYPFGDFDDESIKILKESNFERAVIVRAKNVTQTNNEYSLPRFIVRNWDKDKFKRKINTFK